MNPGAYALTGTNTYLVGTGDKRILIDTGEGRPEYIPNLERAMALAGAVGLQEIVVTHWHFDHLGGVPSVQERFGHVPVRKFMPEVQEETFGGEGAVDPYSVWPKHKFRPLRDGEVIRTEGATLQVLHTPGHANDHVVLVHEEDKAMFTGDNVLGVGTSVFRNLGHYMASLERMSDVAVCRGIKTLYPAHGPVVVGASAKLKEYIGHRQQRIDQVLGVVRTAPATGFTCEEVTRKLYAGIPEDLIHAAAGNTMLVLLKLQGDGKVLRASAATSRQPGDALSHWSARWVPRHSRI